DPRPEAEVLRPPPRDPGADGEGVRLLLHAGAEGGDPRDPRPAPFDRAPDGADRRLELDAAPPPDAPEAVARARRRRLPRGQRPPPRPLIEGAPHARPRTRGPRA